MALSAATVWRDYEADGIPSSGPHKVKKSDVRAIHAGIDSIINAFLSNGGLIFASKASLDADLAHAANSMAWVLGDATVANNGIYRKIGGSGSGSWTRVADLPFSFIIASDIGAGTANAIQATTSIPVSGSALVWTNIFEDNTSSPVTISFNGGTPLTIKTNTGNNVAAGGLVSGMIVMGIVSGATFRLVSDQASSAIVAAAEAAQAAAEAAAAEAVGLVGLAATALQPATGKTSFQTKALAMAATIAGSVKRISTQFLNPTYASIPTLVGGGEYKRVSLAALGAYPASSYFRTVDRFMPDGTADNTNGGYWLLDTDEPDPLQFGAKGDYTTNDYQAITDAATYSAAKNAGSWGCVRFSSVFGYAFSAPLVIPNGQQWKAVGQVALKWLGAGAVALTLVGNSSSAENFTLTNGGGNIVASVGFQLGNGEQGQGQLLKGCFTDGFATGVKTKSGVLWRIEHCIANRSHKYGFHVRNDVNPDSGDGTITGCCASNAGEVYGDAGIFYENGGGLKLTDNKVLSFARGFDLQIPDGDATVDLLMSNNSIENQTVCGVRLGRVGTTGIFGAITLTGNEIAGAPVGVDVYAGAANGIIVGNTFNLCSTGGIRLNTGADNFQVKPNNFAACGADVIDARNAATAQAIEAVVAGGFHVSSASVYTYYAKVTVPDFRTAEVDLLFEGIVQGVGFAARKYQFFATNTGSAVSLTTIHNSSVGASVDLDIDLTTDADGLIIGFRRNSAGGGTVVDGTYHVAVRGRVGSVTRLA